MGAACTAIDPTIATTAASPHVLTDYAWKLCYPGDPYVLEEGELTPMMALASRALDEIQRRLPAKKPPLRGSQVATLFNALVVGDHAGFPFEYNRRAVRMALATSDIQFHPAQ